MIVCPSCQRHVASAGDCPFCAAKIPQPTSVYREPAPVPVVDARVHQDFPSVAGYGGPPMDIPVPPMDAPQASRSKWIVLGVAMSIACALGAWWIIHR